MKRIFCFFCRNWFLIDPLHYLSSRSNFGFEFAEIFVIENDSPTRRAGKAAESGECDGKRGRQRTVESVTTKRKASYSGDCNDKRGRWPKMETVARKEQGKVDTEQKKRRAA